MMVMMYSPISIASLPIMIDMLYYGYRYLSVYNRANDFTLSGSSFFCGLYLDDVCKKGGLRSKTYCALNLTSTLLECISLLVPFGNSGSSSTVLGSGL